MPQRTSVRSSSLFVCIPLIPVFADRLVFFANQPRWFRGNLAAIGIIFALTLLINILAILVPVFRGKRSRAKHLWLVRSKPSAYHRSSLYFPNGRLLGCLFSVASGAIVLVFVVVLLCAPARLNTSICLVPLITLWCTFWFCACVALLCARQSLELTCLTTGLTRSTLCGVAPFIVRHPHLNASFDTHGSSTPSAG